MNFPTRRISLLTASARLNSTLMTDQASALQRVWSIARSSLWMRSQGCQRRAVHSLMVALVFKIE